MYYDALHIVTNLSFYLDMIHILTVLIQRYSSFLQQLLGLTSVLKILKTTLFLVGYTKVTYYLKMMEVCCGKFNVNVNVPGDEV